MNNSLEWWRSLSLILWLIYKGERKKRNDLSVFCKICNGHDLKEKWPTVYNKNIKLYYCNNCNHGFLNPIFQKMS